MHEEELPRSDDITSLRFDIQIAHVLGKHTTRQDFFTHCRGPTTRLDEVREEPSRLRVKKSGHDVLDIVTFVKLVAYHSFEEVLNALMREGTRSGLSSVRPKVRVHPFVCVSVGKEDPNRRSRCDAIDKQKNGLREKTNHTWEKGEMAR